MVDSTWLRAGMGMNYGHHILTSTYSSTATGNDLTYLQSVGINKIRVAYPTYYLGAFSTGLFANMKDVCTQALAKGMYVIWGNDAGSPLTSTTGTGTSWTDYKTWVTGTLAPWAVNAGGTGVPLSELSLGNEEEEAATAQTNGSLQVPVSTVQSDIRSMASTIKGAYPSTTMKLSYQSQVENISTWSGNLGSLDYIGFNSYDNLFNFDSRNQTIINTFGANKAYISEFGCITNGFSDYASEKDWYIDLAARIRSIINRGFKSAYMFTYRDGQFGLSQDGFAMQLSTGATRLAMYAVIGRRVFLVS
jgi:hypothetical protein